MTTAHDEPSDRVPTGRFEWERLVRRAVLPEPVKFTAFVLGSYADPDGSRVRPGSEVLAAVTGKGLRTVRRLVGDLVALGFLELVSRGGGRGRGGRASVYRLTLPIDLLERIELLPPGERPLNPPAVQVASESDESAATQVAGDCGQSPVDNSEPEAIQAAGQSVAAEPIDRPLGDSSEQLTGQTEPIDRPRRGTDYHPTTTPTTKEDHPSSSDPAHPQAARTGTSQNDHDDGGGSRAAPDRCEHNLIRRNRRDGQPACALCRRATQEST